MNSIHGLNPWTQSMDSIHGLNPWTSFTDSILVNSKIIKFHLTKMLKILKSYNSKIPNIDSFKIQGLNPHGLLNQN